MPHPLFGVDAFTDTPFGGNPAAVVLLSEQQDDAWMQAVGREMNLSETAFLLPEGDGYRLRWFTPALEVDLCGHATLASAHVLWETGALEPDAEARFQTRSGLLTARQRDGLVELNFPAQPPAACDPPEEILQALGSSAVWVGQDGRNYLIEYPSDLTVRQMQPKFDLLSRTDTHLVIVTAPAADDRFDFVSRVFVPNAGIPEDPVTGSAHCLLIPYWAERLGKSEMVAYQASARGGVLYVRLDGGRVRIAGNAVTIHRGELVV